MRIFVMVFSRQKYNERYKYGMLEETLSPAGRGQEIKEKNCTKTQQKQTKETGIRKK